MIDLKKVSPEQLVDAIRYERRLEKYESGLLHNYGNKISAIYAVMNYLVDSLETFFEMYPVMGMMFKDIDANYDAVDFGHLPFNDYTSSFYFCTDKYLDLKYHT